MNKKIGNLNLTWGEALSIAAGGLITSLFEMFLRSRDNNDRQAEIDEAVNKHIASLPAYETEEKE